MKRITLLCVLLLAVAAQATTWGEVKSPRAAKRAAPVAYTVSAFDFAAPPCYAKGTDLAVCLLHLRPSGPRYHYDIKLLVGPPPAVIVFGQPDPQIAQEFYGTGTARYEYERSGPWGPGWYYVGTFRAQNAYGARRSGSFVQRAGAGAATVYLWEE